MMNAEQMFNDLDYKKCIKDECIKFKRHIKNVDEALIEFDLDTKTVCASWFMEQKEITIAELRAIIQQAKELGWFEEEKRETNFEHYFEYLSTIRMSEFALINGRVTKCSVTHCSECDFNHDCIEGKFKWLKQPYKKPQYKLTQFEFDLIQTYRDGNTDCKLSARRILRELKDKGYFKCVDYDTKVKDILENCEVIER